VDPGRGFMLRAPIREFEIGVRGSRVVNVGRRGKHLVMGLGREGDTAHLVVNPMLAGRFRFGRQEGPPEPTQVFSLTLDDGSQLRYRDLRRMGRVYWTRELRQIPGWAELGPDADSVPELGLQAFRSRLRRYRDEIKDLLRNQSFLAGLGNAYSDEICFEARLLPLRRRASLTAADEEALYRAFPAVLGRAVAAILANPEYDESRQDRSFMAVHGRGGKPCPRCGHRIGQLGTSREPLNFCRGCQA
ncbi:MAG: DNA-formamidopyrimidine glycosylase family protein, partial [Candidatus Dormibacterales bacterium]